MKKLFTIILISAFLIVGSVAFADEGIDTVVSPELLVEITDETPQDKSSDRTTKDLAIYDAYANHHDSRGNVPGTVDTLNFVKNVPGADPVNLNPAVELSPF